MSHGLIGKPIVTDKQEWKRGEYQGVVVTELPKVEPQTHLLVSCPESNYQPVSINTCKQCVFWHGFAPLKNQRNRMTSLCGFPVGRAISRIKLDGTSE